MYIFVILWVHRMLLCIWFPRDISMVHLIELQKRRASAITTELAVDMMRPTHHPTQMDGATTLALEGTGEVIHVQRCVCAEVCACLSPPSFLPPSLLARDRLQLVISDNPLQEEVRVTAHMKSAIFFLVNGPFLLCH